MNRPFDRQKEDKVRTARANFFNLPKRKLSTSDHSQPKDDLSTTQDSWSQTMSSNKRFKFPGMTTSKPTGTASKTPLIVRFYDFDVQAKDAHGRSMEDILTWPDSQLERCHNYIQMLFPVPEGSAFNWEAPVIDCETMEAFRSRSELRNRLRRSFERMLEFYGFEVTVKPKKEQPEKESNESETPAERTDASTEVVDTEVDQEVEITDYTTFQPDSSSQPTPFGEYHIVRGANFRKNSRNWAVRFDHNHLRITRILRCLRVLGLEKECDAFFAALEDVFNDPAFHISERSMTYWQRAVSRPLYIAPDDDEVEWLKEWEQKQNAAKEDKKETEPGDEAGGKSEH